MLEVLKSRLDKDFTIQNLKTTRLHSRIVGITIICVVSRILRISLACGISFVPDSSKVYEVGGKFGTRTALNHPVALSSIP